MWSVGKAKNSFLGAESWLRTFYLILKLLRISFWISFISFGSSLTHPTTPTTVSRTPGIRQKTQKCKIKELRVSINRLIVEGSHKLMFAQSPVLSWRAFQPADPCGNKAETHCEERVESDEKCSACDNGCDERVDGADGKKVREKLLRAFTTFVSIFSRGCWCPTNSHIKMLKKAQCEWTFVCTTRSKKEKSDTLSRALTFSRRSLRLKVWLWT